MTALTKKHVFKTGARTHVRSRVFVDLMLFAKLLTIKPHVNVLLVLKDLHHLYWAVREFTKYAHLLFIVHQE